jgi:hypothetical protein
MAKRKSRKRGWSGAPTARPAGGTRPAGAATSASDAGAAPGAGAPVAPATSPQRSSNATAANQKDAADSGSAPKSASSGSPAKPTGSVATAAPSASNRAARKEEARRQRELLRRKEARRRAARRWGVIAGAVVVVAGVAVLLVASNKPKSSSHPNPAALPGISTAQAPWPPENAQLSARIEKIGLPPLGVEATDYHIHQNLQVYVHGAPEPVPNGIGNISGTQLAEIHTHTGSGTIHVEAGAQRHYTLGDVFDVWGVLFTKDQLGAYKNKGDDKIRVYVNGKQVTTDPTLIPLKDQEVIIVTYGTPDEVPNPVPSVYHYDRAPTVPGQPAPSGPSGLSGLSGASGVSGAPGSATTGP